jgi:hypothetical protein
MKKGYTKAWRKELDSEIWMMPPLYLKVWYWLRHKVQHDPFLFPTHKGIGVWVLPGQRLTSLQEIAEGVKWSEWGREIIPNKKTIKAVLDWMVYEEMVTIESNAKGTLISIINWDTYNHVDIVESNAIGTRSGSPKERALDTRKECKEGEECKEEDLKRVGVASDKPKRTSAQKMSEEEWIASLKASPAYQGLNIEVLKAKMEAWCDLHGKKPTRARFLNWLNREDKPMAPGNKPAIQASRGVQGTLARIEELRARKAAGGGNV